MVRIVNGRIVPGDIPDSGIFGKDLVRAMNASKGRRAVFVKGIDGNETINPFRKYSKSELISRKSGKVVRMKTMPDRTKGQTSRGQYLMHALCSRIICYRS